MRITSRNTHAFIEVKVDEVETTIFNDSKDEIEEMINDLEEILTELYEKLGKDVFVKVSNIDE